MQRFHKLFDVKKGCQVFGMIHVEALPGIRFFYFI